MMRHFGLPHRRIVDWAQCPTDRWPWRRTLVVFAAFCVGIWIAVVVLIAQVLE